MAQYTPSPSVTDTNPVHNHDTIKSSKIVSESDGVSSLWSNTRNTLSGAASGVAKLVVGHPFDTVKVRLQTETTGRFGGPLDCIMKTVRNEGFTALYKGGTPPLIGWGAIDSVMFAALIPARRWLQGDAAELTMTKHWMAGAIAGWTSCIVATPVELLKAKLQIQYGDAQSQKYRGVVDCVRQTWRFGGVYNMSSVCDVCKVVVLIS